MSDDIQIYYHTRPVYLPAPEMSEVMAAIGRDGQTPTAREVSIAVTAFRMGAVKAAQRIGSSRGARLEADLMGEGEI